MGFASRKFWFCITTSSMIVLVGAVSGVLPAMGAQVATIVGGLVTVCAIFAGGNVASKWVNGKTAAAVAEPAPPEPPKDPPKEDAPK